MQIDLIDRKDFLTKTSFLINVYKESLRSEDGISRTCDSLIQHMALSLLKDVEWENDVNELLTNSDKLVSSKTE